MEPKYYVPEMEEFHPGFEYEYFYQNKWHKHDLGGTPIIHHELDQFKDDLMKIAHAITRVKHLDRSDIEELGWELRTDENADKHTPEYTLQRFYLKTHSETFCTIYDDSAVDEYVFRGNIKNKSELARIMKQTNIV